MAKKPRRRFTLEQRAEILGKFHDSGLTKEAFARQEGYHSSMLGNWLRKEREASHPTPTLVPVDVKPRKPPVAASSLDIVLRSGHRIHVASGFDADLLRQLVAALERC